MINEKLIKLRAIYRCKDCDFESENYATMRNHKASHLGLSLEDYEKYTSLQTSIEILKYKLMIVDTLRYRTAYEKCVNDLIAFEKEHGIERK